MPGVSRLGGAGRIPRPEPPGVPRDTVRHGLARRGVRAAQRPARPARAGVRPRRRGGRRARPRRGRGADEDRERGCAVLLRRRPDRRSRRERGDAGRAGRDRRPRSERHARLLEPVRRDRRGPRRRLAALRRRRDRGHRRLRHRGRPPHGHDHLRWGERVPGRGRGRAPGAPGGAALRGDRLARREMGRGPAGRRRPARREHELGRAPGVPPREARRVRGAQVRRLLGGAAADRLREPSSRRRP